MIVSIFFASSSSEVYSGAVAPIEDSRLSPSHLLRRRYLRSRMGIERTWMWNSWRVLLEVVFKV